MADVTLGARSPLAGTVPHGTLAVAERAGAMLGVQARRGSLAALQAAMRAGWGVELPLTLRLVAADGFAVVWAGPERWLVVSETPDELAPAWRPRIGAHAAVVELGDGRCLLRVAGPGVRDAMARLVPIDLHPRAFGPGDTALTLAGHINVQLWQVDDAPTYDLVVARSLAGSFLHQLSF